MTTDDNLPRGGAIFGGTGFIGRHLIRSMSLKQNALILSADINRNYEYSLLTLVIVQKCDSICYLIEINLCLNIMYL